MNKIIMGCLAALAMASANAETWYEEATGYTWSYTVSGETATITGVSPKESDKGLPIPAEIGGKKVTSIGWSAFYCCSELRGKLTIPATVTLISGRAFYGCSGLTGPLTIPEGVTSIGETAFFGCSGLTGSLTIPEGMTKIELQTFAGCSALNGSLTLPSGLTVIEVQAFSGCSGLTGPLKIPVGVTSIGSSAFSGCRSMTGPLIIPESITKLEDGVFHSCSGLSGSLKIPVGVTSIGNSAFSGCKGLTGTLTIPASVKEIGEYAFGWSLSPTYFQTVICAGGMPKGWDQIPFGVGVQLDRANSGSWLNGGLPIQNFAGYINDEVPAVTVVSSKVRENDATVIDVTYKVTSAKSTVKVRVLAFEDGERSLAKVVRPETFIDGTSVNVGDGVTANEEHTISWKVSSDWATKLAKVKVEVLAMDDALLPLELMMLPATATQPKMQVSWNHVWPEKVFDALLWLYADKDEGLVLQDGVLKTGDKRLAEGTGLDDNIAFDARVYVFGKMGYELLDGERLEYVKARTRLDLPDISVRQYAVKVVE